MVRFELFLPKSYLDALQRWASQEGLSLQELLRRIVSRALQERAESRFFQEQAEVLQQLRRWREDLLHRLQGEIPSHAQVLREVREERL